MSKGSSKQPSAPNPAQVAGAQTASNVNTAVANAWLNSGNTVTPYGNTSTSQIGSKSVDGIDVPIFSQTMTLSPEQQKLYEQGVQGDTRLNDLGLGQIDRIQNAVSQPFSLDAFGPAPTADPAAREKAYGNILARAQPQQDQDRAALEARLASQGVALGSENYGNAMQGFNRGVNDFRLGADIQAGNEEAQQYGLQSGAYQQAISNALLQRQLPLQEYNQFTGASNSYQSPQMQQNPAAMIQPTDTTSPQYANYNARLQQQQGNQATNAGLYGSLAGLGGSALGGWASSGFSW